MGNNTGKMWDSEKSVDSTNQNNPPVSKYAPVATFKFHNSFTEETNNGLFFNDIYLPEELVLIILSHIEPKEILNATLVCKRWCNIIKSNTLWATVYTRRYKKKPKKLPWYVYYCLFTTNYFDRNLIKNGNGQNKLENWRIISNYGDGFKVEDPPAGADPLPLDIPEFYGRTSCFATSYGQCNKLQEIPLENKRLMQFILNQFKPHIYLSEWVAGRFDCGCSYTLWCKLIEQKLGRPRSLRGCRYRLHSESDYSEYSNSSAEDEFFEDPLHVAQTGVTIEQWAGRTWSKVELLVKDYPKGVKSIIFQHLGMDTQYWKGHYGSKMAGGVLKILFDSMESRV